MPIQYELRARRRAPAARLLAAVPVPEQARPQGIALVSRASRAGGARCGVKVPRLRRGTEGALRKPPGELPGPERARNALVLGLVALVATPGCSMALLGREPVVVLAPAEAEARRGMVRAIGAAEARWLMAPAARDAGAPSSLGVPVIAAGDAERIVAARSGERTSAVIERWRERERRAAPSVVGVLRGDGEARVLVVADLERLRRYGDVAQDVPLEAGDTLFVPLSRRTLQSDFYSTFGAIIAW